MPETLLHVASVTLTDSKGWQNETNLVGADDGVYAVYISGGVSETSLLLTFDPTDLPDNAAIGDIAVDLWGSWSGAGSPSPVVLAVGTAPPLEFALSESPEKHENSHPTGWGMSTATLNALEGTLTIITSGVETFSLDAVEVRITWHETIQRVRRPFVCRARLRNRAR
jgi:hypothetical protein